MMTRCLRGCALLRLFFILAATMLIYPAPDAAQEFEYRLKAEFIERFTRFIQWPEDSPVQDPSQPFDLCVTGASPFGTYLDDLSRRTKIKGKEVKVRSIPYDGPLETCAVLFISSSQRKTLSRILSVTADQPILTIGDTSGFAEQGVLVNFYRSGNYVRFEINNAAAQRSGLRFSSRLLKLARLVDSSEDFRHTLK